MRSIIRLMPEALANQIAAGEVVQRPASVVKELLENAKDAGARSIDLIIKDAGKSLIQVVDDGVGMSEIDAQLAFERHATSKISALKDLFTIRTFGFRGEALASIAAVSRVRLKTRNQEDELGVRVEVEGGKFLSKDFVSAPVGTSLSVSHLFFNVPARRNFLKSNAVETRHILNEFFNIAVAYPETHFRFEHNENTIFDLPPVDLKGRLIQLYPSVKPAGFIPLVEEAHEIRVYGLIGAPETQRKTRGEQYFFINRRFIKSGLLMHAVSSAYGSLLEKDGHPFFALFYEINPAKVDVNIHPTKTEVKFEDERSIFILTQSAVRKAIGAALAPFETIAHSRLEKEIYQTRPPLEGPTVRQYKNGNPESRTGRFSIDAFFPEKPFVAPEPIQGPTDVAIIYDVNEPPPASLFSSAPDARVWQMNARFIAAAETERFLILDISAAHRRILYEELLKQAQNGAVPSQQLLFPYSITLEPAAYLLLKEAQNVLRKLGFDIKEVGNHTLLISGTPSEYANNDPKTLFEAFCAEETDGYVNENARLEKWARILAGRKALSTDKMLETSEVEALYRALFRCENPEWAPDGKRTYVEMRWQEIERLF